MMLVVAMTTAFAPSTPASRGAGTALQLKFLKELGLEKPSWLPDFGGEKKDEETSSSAPPPSEEDGEESKEEDSKED